jgi:hypothetical protein
MTLEELSLGGLLALSRQAEELCLHRLERIREWSDPEDGPLHELLEDLVAEERNHLGAIEEYEIRAAEEGIPPVDPAQAERLLRSRLPSLGRRFGEGFLDRDLALFFAESLEEEASRFYRALKEHARDGESRSFFLNMAERDRCSLDHLRSVVLNG